MSGVGRGRVREGVAQLLSMWLLPCILEWKEVSSRFMWAKVKIERQSWVFISANGPSSEKSELNERVGSFDRNWSVVVFGDLNARVGN